MKPNVNSAISTVISILPAYLAVTMFGVLPGIIIFVILSLVSHFFGKDSVLPAINTGLALIILMIAKSSLDMQ